MAIDYTGQVTTTGMMNQSPRNNLQVPDMTNLVPPKEPAQVKQPIQKTDEDKAASEPAVSPSVNEDSIVLPRSIIVNYAMRMYGGNEDEAMNSFITDLSNIQMDTNNVPLDTAPQSSGMMARSQDDSSDIPQDDSTGVDINQDLV